MEIMRFTEKVHVQNRHNAIQNLIYSLLPDPPLFSLPSTFNGGKSTSTVGTGTSILQCLIPDVVTYRTGTWGANSLQEATDKETEL